MNTEGVTPIINRFLRPNFLLALEFQEGFVFGRVIRRRICQYKPYPLTDHSGAVVDIPPLRHQPEIRFRDPRNPSDDVLYLDGSTNAGYPWILHGSIGVKPQQISIYSRFPEGREIPGKFPNINPVRPVVGDNVSALDSTLSPYEEPTDLYEYIIPPKVRVAAEYFNRDNTRAHVPVLNLLFSVYWFEVLNHKTHGSLISSIATRRIPATFFTVGWGDTPHPIGGMLMKDWNATPMTLEQAARCGEHQ